ncbi:hypothetical protein FBEOM_8399 [Fusarium beomiforme]|uniref:Uncharacterized protein n=1 Tax=Fusarium beomiforme TaxID=44412 RepID=A0A9P5AFD9_9HYPO|nr:hypothetical protein FBEOM_8399 [Fusarium beomiforme]
MTDQTALYGDKLAELVTQGVTNPPPAENAVNARLTNIDGTGTAVLASKINTTKNYGGFALIFHDDPKYKDFKWLQFITRQLVVGGAAKTGNLVNKTNTPAYQLVNSAQEITDFTSGAGVPNWNTCWGVDSGLSKVFFADTYEYAISDAHKITAILDPPSVLMGKVPTRFDKDMYKDAPDGLVSMKTELGTSQGISRAYFSDYLVKVEGDRHRIYARFDFILTWNAKESDKTKFTLNSLAATETNSILDCHMAALRHITTPGKAGDAPQEPFRAFRESIIQ